MGTIPKNQTESTSPRPHRSPHKPSPSKIAELVPMARLLAHVGFAVNERTLSRWPHGMGERRTRGIGSAGRKI